MHAIRVVSTLSLTWCPRYEQVNPDSVVVDHDRREGQGRCRPYLVSVPAHICSANWPSSPWQAAPYRSTHALTDGLDQVGVTTAAD